MAPAPTCDGACPPGMACIAMAGVCGCVATSGPCGAMAGVPLCYGDCPMVGESCIDAGGFCECAVIPTLSEWGIVGMSLAMLGGVFYLRRRRGTAAQT